MKILETLVGGGEMYGLELVEATGLKRGGIYVILGRMEDKGYITGREVKKAEWSGMPRRFYRITGQGQQVLRLAQSAVAVMMGQYANV